MGVEGSAVIYDSKSEVSETLLVLFRNLRSDSSHEEVFLSKGLSQNNPVIFKGFWV